MVSFGHLIKLFYGGISEMYSDDKDQPESRWAKIQDELSLPEMLAMYDYSQTGVDSEVIIGDENEHLRLLRNPDIPKGAFTAVGKLTPAGLNKVLKTASKKYKCKVILLCMR